MKRKMIHLFLATVTISGLNAQVAKPPGNRRPPPLLLPVLDADKSGTLSADEIAAASTALTELDKNEDGMLTKKEIAPRPVEPKNSKGRKPPKGAHVLVKAIDLDADGTLNANEIEDAPLSLMALDKDDDGTLSKEEMKPGKPPTKEPV